MASPVLSPAQRKQLRALAHGLSPVVRVGHAGVTDGVVQAVSRALLDHELIKVRLYEPEDKHAMAEAVAARTESALCGLLGHTVVLYRPHPEAPRIALRGSAHAGAVRIVGQAAADGAGAALAAASVAVDSARGRSL